ncbi:ProQ/FINO family protein [Halomonas sp. DWK9]|uniref:ProQ/FINO family protein n=1 Tax=Halomonas sp. DWK9 TaxID=3060155 RepID=UPI00287F51BD|nr:ProQ/FINO family protein [Halomonas sp. DWK9]
MAASVLHLLETLETRLEHKNAELTALRAENQRLKQQLALLEAGNAVPTDEPPAEERLEVARAEVECEAAPEQEAVQEQGPVVTPEPPSASEAATEAAETPPSPQVLLKQWYQRYPEAFFKGHTKPLKVGIHQDLAEREPWSGKLIRRALANYVNLPRYVKSMREGAERVDLDGQPSGKVDKEAAQHASERRKEHPGTGGIERAAAPLKSQAEKEAGAASKATHAPQRQPAKKVITEKSEQKKPLSLEEKLKGLQQKFEGH